MTGTTALIPYSACLPDLILHVFPLKALLFLFSPSLPFIYFSSNSINFVLLMISLKCIFSLQASPRSFNHGGFFFHCCLGAFLSFSTHSFLWHLHAPLFLFSVPSQFHHLVSLSTKRTHNTEKAEKAPHWSLRKQRRNIFMLAQLKIWSWKAIFCLMSHWTTRGRIHFIPFASLVCLLPSTCSNINLLEVAAKKYFVIAVDGVCYELMRFFRWDYVKCPPNIKGCAVKQN